MAAEKEFEQKVKAYLKEQGCWVLKTWSNGIQREGVPDLLVCCNGFFLGVESKAPNGKPSELQLWNVDKIRNANGVAIVLYPDQFEQFKTLVEALQNKCYYVAYCSQFFEFKRDNNERKSTNEAGN